MISKKLTVIVPRLPPSINGLGDYGLRLAKQMRQDFGIDTEFIVADPSWLGGATIEGFSIEILRERSSSALLKCLVSKNIILLHYVGYGYAKRGCPIWMVRALKKWHNSSSDKKLITMFHELYAFGPVWTSQFWTSPIQRKLVYQLSKLSDHCLTSKNTYAHILKKYSWAKHPSIEVMPVFSNIGELENSLPLASRKKHLVIFGSPGWRSRVYRESLSELIKTINELEIEKVIDIGSPLDALPDIPEVIIEVKGNLSSEAISVILADSIIGFFTYPPGYLSKSGIFASYCSHGVIPIGSWKEDQSNDGVLEGTHFWLVDKYSQKMNLEMGQVVATNAYSWYQEHRLSVQAKKFADFLV